MKLFKSTDGFNVEIDPEILLIKAFNELYVDRNGDEVLIKAELAFVYFFNDPVSDFMFETNDSLREEDVKKHVNLSPKWKPDAYIHECGRVYRELSETTASYLLSATKKMSQKIREQMELIDLAKLDKNDKPVYDIKKFIESAKAIPGLIEVLVKAEKEFIRDQQEASKNKGSKTKSMYEDM
jgi:hypothetical protein